MSGERRAVNISFGNILRRMRNRWSGRGEGTLSLKERRRTHPQEDLRCYRPIIFSFSFQQLDIDWDEVSLEAGKRGQATLTRPHSKRSLTWNIKYRNIIVFSSYSLLAVAGSSEGRTEKREVWESKGFAQTPPAIR